MNKSFFDTAERGAVTLTLSTNDPFEAVYLTQEGIPLYLVSTRRCPRSSSKAGGLAAGLGLDAEVTTVKRVRADPQSASSSSSSSSTSNASTNKTYNEDTRDTDARRSWPPRSYTNTNHRRHRRGALPQHRKAGSSSMLSLGTPPLDTIDEVADADGTDTDGVADADAGVSVDADRGARSEDSDRPGSSSSNHSAFRPSSDSPSTILVATIERRPFSLSPVQLHFNGSEGAAGKFLQRERPFSSTRCFVSITGDLLKWQLSTPVPKLYNSSNKARLAKYCAPFLPSKGVLSSSHAVLEIAQGIESDRALDEIVVTLLLSFLL